MGNRNAIRLRLERLTSGSLAVLCLIILPTSTLRAQCTVPSDPQVVSSPSGILATGQTYTLGWTADGGDNIYIVERSTSSSFNRPDDEAQYVSAKAASFIAFDEGTYFHRVSAVAGCDVSKVSGPANHMLSLGPLELPR